MMLQTVKHPSESVHQGAAGWAWRQTEPALKVSSQVPDLAPELPLQVPTEVQTVGLRMVPEPAVVSAMMTPVDPEHS